MSKRAGKEPFYILGYPLGFTEQVYYQVVKGIRKGTNEYLNRGEVFNFKTVSEPLNVQHHDLIRLHEKGENRYWCESNRLLKEMFLDDLHNYNSKFLIIRDTVEPKIMTSVLKDTYNPKVLMIKPDKNYLVEKLYENDIFFPTNIIDRDEKTKKNLELSIEKSYEECFYKLKQKRTNAYILDVKDFFKSPIKVLDIVENMGFDVKKENYIGEKLNKYKKMYKSK